MPAPAPHKSSERAPIGFLLPELAPARLQETRGGEGAMARPDPSAPPSLLLLYTGATGGPGGRRLQGPGVPGDLMPMCRGIGYNLTHMPNQFNHDTQDRRAWRCTSFGRWWIHCSPDLRFSCAPCTRPSACRTTTSHCRPAARCANAPRPAARRSCASTALPGRNA